jgi:uncharacterized membrane protein YkoI
LIYVSDLSGRLGHIATVKLAHNVMRMRLRPVLFWFALAAAMTPAEAARTDSRDHDAVRLAVERGEIRPLVEILAIIRDKLPGHVAGVEIERKAGRWLYEFRVVDGKGRLFEVYVDARTGNIERIKEK